MKNSETAIEVENISKYYRIGVKEEMNDALTSILFNFVKKPISNYYKYRSLYRFNDKEIIASRNSDSVPEDILWALRDIDLEVKRGEIIGVIGSNGAGKSTLLKILSRITHPSTGYAKIMGRVSCLLEVGTGFHPELTGRENVYLNGTVLGMKKSEIDAKFDEIVDFSGIEKFIDTPVKRYSSGMKVRLAFSVAAHLEPEILIIDEVLAVGDAQFQKKCLGKMDTVAKQGRTLLFVSHNMGAVNQLCTRAVLLENGRIINQGKTEDIISAYLMDNVEKSSRWICPEDHPQNDMRINCVRVLTNGDQATTVVDHDQGFSLELQYDIYKEVSDAVVMCRITDSMGNIVFSSWDTDAMASSFQTRKSGKYITKCKIDGNLLKPGIYLVSVGAFILKSKTFGFFENILSFEVSPLGYTLNPGRRGIVAPVFDWDTDKLDG